MYKKESGHYPLFFDSDKSAVPLSYVIYKGSSPRVNVDLLFVKALVLMITSFFYGLIITHIQYIVNGFMEIKPYLMP